MRPDWFPDWTGETCVIVGAGPSAGDAPLELARGRAKIIAINTSWRLAPFADVLYGCDARWWRSKEGKAAIDEFKGILVSQDVMATEKAEWNVRLVRTDRSRSDIITKHPGRLGWGGTQGGNGGFQSMNLAIQFGSARLLLVGLDMRVDRGVHWHGEHPRPMNNPRAAVVARWRTHIDRLAGRFRKLGVEVINCSAVSALNAYPKMTLQEALGLEAESRAAA